MIFENLLPLEFYQQDNFQIINIIIDTLAVACCQCGYSSLISIIPSYLSCPCLFCIHLTVCFQ